MDSALLEQLQCIWVQFWRDSPLHPFSIFFLISLSLSKTLWRDNPLHWFSIFHTSLHFSENLSLFFALSFSAHAYIQLRQMKSKKQRVQSFESRHFKDQSRTQHLVSCFMNSQSFTLLSGPLIISCSFCPTECSDKPAHQFLNQDVSKTIQRRETALAGPASSPCSIF